MKPTEPRHLSKLTLDRYATGELSSDEARWVEAQLDDRARRHLDAVTHARTSMAALDIGALRARAATLSVDDDGVVAPEVDDSAEPRAPATIVSLATRRRPRTLSMVLGGALLAAACVVGAIGLGPSLRGLDPAAPTVAFRGDALTLYLAQGDELHPYERDTVVGAGDVLGFRVVADGHESVVLLSVDGTGMVSVFFPTEGRTALPLEGTGSLQMPGTVMLDGAPGPEVFVAVFDQPADQARRLVRDTYWAQGHQGLRRLGALRPDVAIAEVTRR